MSADFGISRRFPNRRLFGYGCPLPGRSRPIPGAKVFDAPVASQVLCQIADSWRKADDEEHRLLVILLARLAVAVDHSNRFQPRPAGKPLVVLRDRDHVVLTTLLAAMRFLHRYMPTEALHLVILFAVFFKQVKQ